MRPVQEPDYQKRGERTYIGRRFKNDTERLEKLFELYTQMTAKVPAKKAGRKKA